MIRYRSMLALLLLFGLFLAGCKGVFPERREIDQFEIIRVVGIDQSTEDPSQVEVTFISKTEKSTSEKESNKISQVSIESSSGATVFDAERKLKAHSDKMPFFGHTDYFIIGEDAAREDFTKYFDFINRDHEIRLSPKIYIVEGCSAKDLINKTSTGDKFIADRLKNLEFDKSILSNTNEVKIIEVENMLDNVNAATVIPTLKLEDIHNEKMNVEMPEKDIKANGYAVIKDFKLAGFIDEECSRGYNFLTNEVESCPISIKDKSGQFVGLEVFSSKTTIKAQFQGAELVKVTFTTHVTSNIEEQHSRDFLFSAEALQDLCAKQSGIIQNEMRQVIDLSKKYQTDCTELWKKIRMKHPFKWEKLKDNWNEIYQNLDIEVVVLSDISRTYDIREPNGYQIES